MNSGRDSRTCPGPVGILGGTFDPIHHGHLRAAIEACEALDLDHVRLVPLYTPNHRDAPRAPPELRAAMASAAARPPIEVDVREIERGGVSYTVDTLAEFRRERPRVPLCLLLGMDAYRSIPGWHRPREILRLAHVVVVSRPGTQEPALPGLDEIVGNAQSDRVRDLHESPAGRVYFLDIPLLPITSSDLRRRRADGRNIRCLVPDAVHDIIVDHGLYLE